ncbi:MAG: TlpA disulfide reductase family protein [Candidatus Omnitrophota bacterium]
MKKKILLLLLASFCLSISAFAAPEKFEKYSGEAVTYDEILSSPKVVLFLWTTRCPYCREELQKMNLDYTISKYAKFYFVDIGERRQDVEKVVKSMKLKEHIFANIIFDKDAKMAEKFSIIGVPTFIYMRNGQVVDQGYYFDESILKTVFRNE